MRNIFSTIWILLILGFISCKGTESPKSGIPSNETEKHSAPHQAEEINIADAILEDSTTQTIPETVTTPQLEEAEKPKSTPQAEKKPDLKPVGEISFDAVKYDFGRLPQGQVVKKEFKFTNAGKGPLNIKSVGATCGCTVPSYPFMTIEPGGEGHIGVEFNSTGKMGIQRQKVTVNTDGNPARITLYLNGVVIPKSEVEASSQ